MDGTGEPGPAWTSMDRTSRGASSVWLPASWPGAGGAVCTETSAPRPGSVCTSASARSGTAARWPAPASVRASCSSAMALASFARSWSHMQIRCWAVMPRNPPPAMAAIERRWDAPIWQRASSSRKARFSSSKEVAAYCSPATCKSPQLAPPFPSLGTRSGEDELLLLLLSAVPEGGDHAPARSAGSIAEGAFRRPKLLEPTGRPVPPGDPRAACPSGTVGRRRLAPPGVVGDRASDSGLAGEPGITFEELRPVGVRTVRRI
mmetsp:Transcript_100899/g.311210  ORF Transcript_100899/g.311210 Transcript_100899/m.311210 type:complete len:262 (+) Transcript_100899:1385-2170(+)